MPTEFGTKLGKEITINENEERILIANTINSSKITLEKNANLMLIIAATEAVEGLQEIHFDFKENAKLTFIALIIGKNSDEFEFKTISNHKVKNTTAHFYIRSALFDNSKINYEGKIKVDAEKTDTYLSHHTFLFSENAKVQTTPSLEIKAEDVKAGHAATTGKIDPETMFYLNSRGINKELAEKILIKGFMEADLKKIPDENARLTIAETLINSLSKCLT